MPRHWAGPPPLLIAVTVLGILVAPAVSRADADPAVRDPAVATAETAPGATPTPEPAPTPTPEPSPSPSPTPTSTPDPTLEPTAEPTPEPTPEPTAPAEPTEPTAPSAPSVGAVPPVEPLAAGVTPRRIGVATFNQYIALSPEATAEDALSLTSRPTVSIIGWQEGFEAGPAYRLLVEQGWATKRYAATRGARELAVSWRKSEFAFVASKLHKLADGVSEADGRYPFGTRYGLRVTLRDRASGELISVIDTHLPQRIEDLDSPGTFRTTKNAVSARRQLEGLRKIWDEAPGRWVVGTGDYNIGALADMRGRSAGGISDAYTGVARSSYSLLGFAGLEATHPYSGRYIDYVHVARPDLAEGLIELVGQRTMNGFTSDHRPLLVRMILS